MLIEYVGKINVIPEWKLDGYLPESMKKESVNEKIKFLTEKYKETNPIYKMLKNDLDLLKQNAAVLEDLESINLDPRYLESIGYKEDQITDYYQFVEKIKDNLGS